MASQYDAAVAAIDSGDVETLRRLLGEEPELVKARGESNTPLLVQVIDWPGHRPRAAESARALLEAGADVEVRRDARNGTALSGAVCTEKADVIEVLLEFGADIHAPCGWEPGTVLDLVDRLCQNLERADDKEIIAFSRLFSQAAGRHVPKRTRLGGTVPLLFAVDVPKALKDYCDVLGFHTNFVFESESECEDIYASIQRGVAEFHLTNCQCDDRRHIGNLYVRVETDAVDDLYEELCAVDVRIRKEPRNQPWGLREFEIEDPGGNSFIFTGPIPDSDSDQSESGTSDGRAWPATRRHDHVAFRSNRARRKRDVLDRTVTPAVERSSISGCWGESLQFCWRSSRSDEWLHAH